MLFCIKVTPFNNRVEPELRNAFNVLTLSLRCSIRIQRIERIEKICLRKKLWM